MAIRGNSSTWLFGYGGAPGSEDISIGTQDKSGSRTLTMAAGGYARMKILANGNIGIGTVGIDKIDALLTVAGKIHAQEVKVTVNAGADFVFADDYALPDLKTVEAYVKENKHLPEIASAAEMEANGLLLAEMNIKLLQKVEELTLYMIEQNEKTTALIEKTERLEQENTQLKARLEALEAEK